MTLGGIVAASLLFLPMWPTYLQVLLDANHPAGVFYSAQDIPLLAIPLVAWATRQRDDASTDRRTASRATSAFDS